VAPLRRRDLDPDPLRQFGGWFATAAAGDHAADVTAVALATATPSAVPSVRMVLLHGFDQHGFRFYTGYASRKASELDRNPHAAMLFHWPEEGRQVRIEGAVARLPADQSDAYFASRPVESRLGAWASHQGAVLDSRTDLEQALATARDRFGSGPIPRPERWGGYQLTASRFEFWQHGANRLHDRFVYRPEGIRWVIERLAP
jgi:pyridoxamine 5'-phosphate oxidase